MTEFEDLIKKHNIKLKQGEVGEGWVPLLNKLFLDLKSIGWNGEIEQIKEKFGQLRVYLGEGSTNKMYEFVFEAEKKSASLCEDCGTTGRSVSVYGWFRTLCSICEVKSLSNKQ